MIKYTIYLIKHAFIKIKFKTTKKYQWFYDKDLKHIECTDSFLSYKKFSGRMNLVLAARALRLEWAKAGAKKRRAIFSRMVDSTGKLFNFNNTQEQK